MDLPELQQHWEQFGRDDPLWAVITDPAKRNGRWDPEEFMDSGRVEVERNLAHLKGKRFAPPRGRALDFGCGPGRATQALCRHFDAVEGVDIAPSMIALARAWNEFGAKCRYHVNDRPDLSIFADGSIDFIYTFHVLQHMSPDLQAAYLKEFARCLSPRGVALIEIVTGEKTGASGALESSAFSAAIDADIPEHLTAQSEVALDVRVRNTSPVAWPARGTSGWYGVTVANRWRTSDGRLSVADDGRAPLVHDLEPGEAMEVVLPVRTPEQPGAVTLEIDLVQEGVTWFQDAGSVPLRRAIEIVGSGATPKPKQPDPRMEMHVLPMEVCLAAVSSGGAYVADVTAFTVIHGGQDLDFERTCVTLQRRSALRPQWIRKVRSR